MKKKELIMLKRVSIQNFKSLKDVTLDLQKVNLLIGPNNSGKTNFLKALEFMANTQTNSGFDIPERFIYRSSNGEKNITDKSLAIHTVHHGNDTYGMYEQNKMHKKKRDNKSYYVVDGIATSDDLTYNFSDNGDDPKPESGNFQHLVGIHLKNVKIYKPDPNKFIQPADFTADSIELRGDCSNLIPFLFYLSSNYKRVQQQIEIELERCTQDVVGFSTPPIKVGADSKLGLKFFDKLEQDYWADEVSEGVLYFLAILCIINQPNPPKLLLLEEPEKGIHPRRIREVMDFIFRLAEEKDVQIILTTHNEHVLDDFATRPESVFVFDKDEEGATYVRNLQTDIIEPTNQRNKELGLDPIDLTTNLSENWLYGLLGGVPSIL